jgi:hypothetical protein
MKFMFIVMIFLGIFYNAYCGSPQFENLKKEIETLTAQTKQELIQKGEKLFQKIKEIADINEQLALNQLLIEAKNIAQEKIPKKFDTLKQTIKDIESKINIEPLSKLFMQKDEVKDQINQADDWTFTMKEIIELDKLIKELEKLLNKPLTDSELKNFNKFRSRVNVVVHPDKGLEKEYFIQLGQLEVVLINEQEVPDIVSYSRYFQETVLKAIENNQKPGWDWTVEQLHNVKKALSAFKKVAEQEKHSALIKLIESILTSLDKTIQNIQNKIPAQSPLATLQNLLVQLKNKLIELMHKITQLSSPKKPHVSDID